MRTEIHTTVHVVSVLLISYLLHHMYNTETVMKGFSVKQREPCENSSSIWCVKDQPCHLKHVCFRPDSQEFIMFTDINSIIDIPDPEASQLTLDLSSVRNHNALKTNVVILPKHLQGMFNMTWSHHTTLVFQRFLPGNLMHVFHDDILPLHHTLKLIQPGWKSLTAARYDVEIFLLERNIDPVPEIDELYQQYSKYNLMFLDKFLDNITSMSYLHCFEDLYIGLSRYTTWYDFGFTQPQGPVSDMKVKATNIQSTVAVITRNLEHIKTDTSNYIVLLTRKDNRKILNEVDLSLAIVRELRLKVFVLCLETHSLPELIVWTQNSRGIIGMHGSLLILCMFLKPGAFLMELFPFAVNPDRYTPYKTLAELKGMNIVYRPWVNVDTEKTVGHPEYPAELGGLLDLIEVDRETIVSQTEVPPHLCCSDPSWLYHIYQDTSVDLRQLIQLLRSALKEAENIKPKDILHDVHPNKVVNVTCKIDDKTQNSDISEKQFLLSIQWSISWLVAVIGDQKDVKYEMLVQDSISNNVMSLTTYSNMYTVSVDSYHTHHIWVRCVVHGNAGPYSDVAICKSDHD